jgi:phosphatidylserine/phosphatidylglycerophosphate/cardiolipin synthase-like enzyme
VDVDVLLPANPDTHGPANKVMINRLLASKHKDKIRVFLYPLMSHAKVLMVDGEMAGVGSANLTPRSMLTAKELTVFVHGNAEEPFIRRLRTQIDADLAKSAQVRESFPLTFKDKISAVAGKYVW